MMIKDEDMYRFLASSGALASWHMARTFSGSEQMRIDRYVHSLALRGSIMNWSDEKIAALIEMWGRKHRISQDLKPRLTLLLPSARERARPYVKKWSAERAKAEVERAQKAAARPRARILYALQANPNAVVTPARIAAELDIKEALCRQTMLRMVTEGELTRIGYGRYRLASATAEPAESTPAASELQHTREALQKRSEELKWRLADTREHNKYILSEIECSGPSRRDWARMPDELRNMVTQVFGSPYDPLKPPPGKRFKSTRRITEELIEIGDQLWCMDNPGKSIGNEEGSDLPF